MTFQDLNIHPSILKALSEQGYEQPTPIQEGAIPVALSGKDLLGCAQTGTGKTAAFAIPILQLLEKDRPKDIRGKRAVRSLILTPTRELAIQIQENLEAYGRHLQLKHLVIFGGVNQNPQTEELRKGVDILVATPGRLLDLMNQGFVRLNDVGIFVLDEADRMLDMGFVHDVKRVIAKLPVKRQTLFFSATMPAEIQSLAATILHHPVRVEVTPVSTTAETITQSVYQVAKENKRRLLAHVLSDEAIGSVLVFTRTKHGADRVARDLSRIGIRAEAIHGNKSQNARQKALSNFKSHETRVLVATDIAARGIDIDNLTHVINFEIPNVPETYVHRIGRTGRAGASGISLSFCDEEEAKDLRDIQKLIGKQIPVEAGHPWHLDFSTAFAVPVPAAPRQQGGQEGRKKAAGQNRSRHRFRRRPANG